MALFTSPQTFFGEYLHSCMQALCDHYEEKEDERFYRKEIVILEGKELFNILHVICNRHHRII